MSGTSKPSTAPGASAGAAAPDFRAIRDRQQATWATGDFSVIGGTIVIVSELICEAVDLRAGARVLDVATGAGNAAIAAARRFCEVVGTDYVPALLERGRTRAAAEGLEVEFREADADRQPFPDASFDFVLSVFGAMFAPNPEAAAAELLRVCKPGGKIALANWTPEGFAGQMFKVNARHVPPPAGVAPPVLWGTPARIQELFGRHASAITTNRRVLDFRYRSIPHYLEIFRRWFGPMAKAFESLDAAGKAALERDLTAMLEKHNRSGDATAVIPSEYLEVVITKK